MIRFILGIIVILLLFQMYGHYVVGEKDVKSLFSRIESKENQMKELVGLKVIFEKDTLMITDYSFFRETITFSNGKEINYLIGKNLTKVE